MHARLATSLYVVEAYIMGGEDASRKGDLRLYGPRATDFQGRSHGTPQFR